MGYDIKQILVIRKDLNMRKGKIGAMCDHASMAFITRQVGFIESIAKDLSYTVHKSKDNNHYLINLSDIQLDWINNSFAKIVVYVNSEQELLDLIAKGKEAGIVVHKVVDSGATEFHGVPTLTCAAFGPDKSENLDKITGKLSLL